MLEFILFFLIQDAEQIFIHILYTRYLLQPAPDQDKRLLEERCSWVEYARKFSAGSGSGDDLSTFKQGTRNRRKKVEQNPEF